MKKHSTVSLTPKQQRFYETLRSHIARRRESPTVAELQKSMKLSSPRAVSQYLESLEKKGLIKRSRYATRGISLVSSAVKSGVQMITIPLIASAGCDNVSVLAQRTFDEYICVSSDLLQGRKKQRVVSIKAIGESMNEAGVNDGDYVLVEVTDAASEDDLVVAIIDGFAVIKKLEYANNAVILKPVSSYPVYKPIIMRRDFTIFGRVLDIIRRPQHGELEIVPLVSGGY